MCISTKINNNFYSYFYEGPIRCEAADPWTLAGWTPVDTGHVTVREDVR